MRSYLTDPKRFLKNLGLSPQDIAFSSQAHAQFKFKVPVSFADKIQYGDKNDPLLRQIFPITEELEKNTDYLQDPLYESNSLSQPGLLQKYHGRALLLVTPNCAINCRYCFRRHYPYDDNGHFWTQLENNITFIQNDASIEEVILSGGDPLSLSDDKINTLLEKIEVISHIKRLRIHTRFPIVDPQRIGKNLMQRLSQSTLKIIMVLHINHAQEIAEDNQYVISNLHQHNILLFNQSVLLKGVNDNLETLTALSEKLIENQIIPYYLHLLDKVLGSHHFAISDEKAVSLYQQLRKTPRVYAAQTGQRNTRGEE